MAIALFQQPDEVSRLCHESRRAVTSGVTSEKVTFSLPVEIQVGAIIDTSSTPDSFPRVEEVCLLSQHGFGLSPFYDHLPFEVSRCPGSEDLKARLIRAVISEANRPIIEVGSSRATRGAPSSVAKPNRRLPGGVLRRYKRSQPKITGFERVTVAQLSRRSR